MDRRRFLQTAAATGSGLALFGSSGLWQLAQARDQKKPDIAGLRNNIDHIIVIYQENRSFDHYFGTYQNPKGTAVANLLDAEGKLDPRFTGLQKNPAGMQYKYLPVPDDIPGFDGAKLTNKPFHLAPYIPASHNVPWDPEHHFYRMYAEVDGGRMDHFVALALSRHHKPFKHMAQGHIDATRLQFKESKPSGAVLGFYQRDDIPDYHKLADNYALFDHFFQAMSGGSTGNALYLAAARSAQWKQVPKQYQGSLRPPFFDLPYDDKGMLINDLPPVLGPTEIAPDKVQIAPPPKEQTYPNIGDRLDKANVSWAWYNHGWNAVKHWAMKRADGQGDGSMMVDSESTYEPHHNPFQYYPSWFDNVRAGRMRDTEDFYADVKKGELPSVSFLKAAAEHDEHPADSAPQWGMNWVMNLLKAIGESPIWDKTAVVITYDEGGGLWDHVAPPRPDNYGCGTRIPALLVSPYAKPGHVDHHVADTTSVLSLIEARFKLDPMSSRDAKAYNLVHAFDFNQSPQPPKFM